MSIISLVAKKEQRRRKDYADLVMQKFHEMEKAEQREKRRGLLDNKTMAHFNAKDRI